MTVAAPASSDLRFHSLFPSWESPRPVAWFFAEQLLEARAGSEFPTNRAGDDEDVNIYLIGLLEGWCAGDARRGILPGGEPLLRPPPQTLPVTLRAEHHRRQADHRLLALGLFDRGDLTRRRRRGWRLTEAETRARDLAVMVRGYEQAASLLECRGGGRAGQVSVWQKLARHGPSYVNVLQALSRRRLGFGARLDEGTIARMLAMSPEE